MTSIQLHWKRKMVDMFASVRFHLCVVCRQCIIVIECDCSSNRKWTCQGVFCLLLLLHNCWLFRGLLSSICNAVFVLCDWRSDFCRVVGRMRTGVLAWFGHCTLQSVCVLMCVHFPCFRAWLLHTLDSVRVFVCVCSLPLAQRPVVLCAQLFESENRIHNTMHTRWCT